MDELVAVCSQAELDRVVAAGDIPVCKGNRTFVVGGSATVEASDSATVEAWGSATVRAWGSATVEASDSATVEAWGSATVRASGSAMVRALQRAVVEATQFVAVTDHGPATRINGGHILKLPAITTAEQWCDFHGAQVTDGVVVLFKAVDDEYRSGHGFVYTPGSQPEAPDWDGGERECGGGLHFCARPMDAKTFNPGATRYVACPVRLDEIVVHHPANYPTKVKAPRVVGPVYEVDIDGAAIAGEAVAS